MKARAERLERHFLSFFATETDGTAAALFRVTLGLLAVWQAVGVWLNLRRFWGDDGLVPFSIVAKNEWIWLSPFARAPASDAVLYGHAVVFTVASAALLLGVFPRIAALVVAFVHLSFQLRNPFILNSGDRLFMIVAALAVAVPLGHRFSVHSLVRRLRGLAPPAPATVWGMRFIQLQLAYVYLNSTIAKLGNTRWRTGMALRDVLASPVFAEWPSYIDGTPFIWFLTYSTLVFELAFPLFIWFRRIRWFLILWGIGFHMGIDVLMVIPIFSYIMIASYPACLSDDELKDWAAWVRRKLGREAAPTHEGTREDAGPAESVDA